MRKWQRQPFTPRSRGRALTDARPQFGHHRGNSAIRRQGSHAVVPGFRAPFPTTGRAIVDTVCGFPPSEVAKDQTFDVPVKPANIEEHFERRRIDRERYRGQRRDRGRDCGALSRQPSVPRPTRFSCGPPKLCAVILARARSKCSKDEQIGYPVTRFDR
jgi:hypothetical protein